MEPYTEQQMFELRNVEAAHDTIVDRFNAKLICITEGKEEVISKRRYSVKEVKDKGYIGFDAYNHNVDLNITQRIRITYIGKDYVCVFVRTPAQGNVPHLVRVPIGDYQEVCSVKANDKVSYKLLVKPKTL